MMEYIIILFVFGILFLGELGDKTQLIVFNLSLKHEKSYKVGIGATLGFAAIVTLGVFIGAVITQYIPILIISIISGLVFIIIGILEARDLKKLYLERNQLTADQEVDIEPSKNEENSKGEPRSKLSKIKENPYIAGFLSIFVMELGDKTQILTISLASLYPHPLEVWLGSFFALISLAWMGVLFGAFIAKKVPKFHLKLISVVIFIFIGILILFLSI